MKPRSLVAMLEEDRLEPLLAGAIQKGGELLAEIEELKKERDRYRSALKRIAALEREWSVQSEAVRIASEALADA